VARDRLRWPEFDAALAEIDTFPRSPGLRAFAVFLRAHAALARGARRRSLHEVEQLLQDGPPDMPVRDLFERLRIQLLVSLGDLAGATAVAANAGAIGAVETARLLLAEGRFAAAAETVAASPAWEWASRRERIDLRLLAATASQRLGDEDRARELVRQAVAHAGGIDLMLYQLATSDRAALRAVAARDPLAARALAAIEASAVGEAFAYPRSSTGGTRLTPRERTVLRHLASDMTLRQIAQVLVVSPNTLNSQVRSIYRKLGVSSRAVAVQSARAQGLLSERAVPGLR
jgi:LuxR family maltose regulon positive regulatory protein